MLTRLCITVIAVATVACGSANSQSILLDKGERGVFLQLEYSAMRRENVRVIEFDLGYALNDRIDLGGSVGHGLVDVRYPPSVQNVTMAGQFLNLYPFKSSSGMFTASFGLHEAYSWTFAVNKNPWFTYGASLNLLVSKCESSGVIFSVGASGATSSTQTNMESAIFGFSIFNRIKGGNPFNVMLEYMATSQFPDTYAVGIAYTFKRR